MPLETIAPSESKAIELLKKRLSGFETEEGRLKGLNFKPRPDDIFIVATPKAGTTWVQQVCHQLRTGGDMGFEEISQVVPWIELAHDQGQDLEAEQVAHPRCFKTHCWYDHCPKEAKYIVVVRNPNDVALSFFKFFEGWFFQPGEVSLDAFVKEFWLARGKPQSLMQNASYFHHFLSWWGHRNDENVLWLFFEELKEGLSECVKRIADFTGIHCSQQLLKKVTEMSTFEYMKQHDDKFDEKISKRTRNAACGLPPDAGLSSKKVRSGGVGEGALELSLSLKAAIRNRWDAVITEATGFSSYDELRQHFERERYS
jgi:sulfotransferase family protein